jgi:hypothetical protein
MKFRKILFLFPLLLVFFQQTTAIAAGCNLRDNFDDGLNPFWVVSDPTYVRGIDGTLDIDFYGDPPDYHWARIDNCTYEDFLVTYQCRDLDYTRGKAFAFRLTGSEPVGYILNLRSYPFNDVVLTKGMMGEDYPVILAQESFQHNTGEWVDVEVIAKKARITVYLNGIETINYFDQDPYLEGSVMFTTNAGATQSAHAQYDDFSIRAFPSNTGGPKE